METVGSLIDKMSINELKIYHMKEQAERTDIDQEFHQDCLNRISILVGQRNDLNPDRKFVIIGDYKCDVLEKYLAAFADVDYEVVNANGKKGTCGGLGDALCRIPDNEPFLLIWSDLVLNRNADLDEMAGGNYIGLSKGFECRWKYENGRLSEEKSDSCGVAGLFLFENKQVLAGVPAEGEFVKWLSGSSIPFQTVSLDSTKEYGLISEYNKLGQVKCRPFNKITVGDSYIIKEGIDEQGRQLAIREKAWYEKTMGLGYKNLPKIYSLNPLKIEKINGRNIYEYSDMPLEKKKAILKDVVGCLKKLHAYGSVPYDEASFREAYLDKTFRRLEKIQDLVPFAHDGSIVVNGKECRNVFFLRDRLWEEFSKIKPDKFVFLHGDCTFSNLMLRNGSEPVMIDPRGYFGRTELYGDAAYDWAKLYYSVVGNYDQFNLKRFRLSINEGDVQLRMESSGWEGTEGYFFELLKDEVTEGQIKLIHAIIWLSLTTYAWEDYDSVCGAFYNGLLCLEEVL